MEGGGGCLCYPSGPCLCDASLLGVCWGMLCPALAPRRGGLHAGPRGWELLECAGGSIGTAPLVGAGNEPASMGEDAAAWAVGEAGSSWSCL